MTACTRSRAPVFSSTRRTCFFTVDSASTSSRAISAFVRPLPTASSTSSSRPLSTPSRASAGGTPGASRPYAPSSSIRRTRPGATAAPPAATARIPAVSSPGSASLSRKPLAPARSPA
jgi:hypothetical protein